ncbi:phospholipid/cholesterol/gamma-HCH transport system substrate-binding protein [Gilliamella bombicola]|uniref:Phospholipid/cholesterol/gamma-HCH transport system substrate-binding protein n=1 Tax=Gilliamella bombicola TaxID=1798182 RepID=A0A1C3Z3Z6_9GAMM|nr:outer membrane lipid asymmetry maintenance protein MlaD [Gilliamella bombicola]SCB77065.1 phospholipid/cholesterol/gamma-HCH transport system substrate-binding protein [Gilliamella bombicola]
MSRKIEITVGLFMVLVICSVLFLCFKVTDPTSFASHNSYRVYAVFENIGGLKARSPIKIGGVVIGRVSNISLNSSNGNQYKPYVAMDIDAQYNKIPSSSSLSIKTSGILGEQFIDINIGVDRETEFSIDASGVDPAIVAKAEKNKTPPYLLEGFVVQNTTPALVLEDLIGKFLYSIGGSSDKDKANKDKKEDTTEN